MVTVPAAREVQPLIRARLLAKLVVGTCATEENEMEAATMTEQTERTEAQPGAVPARVELEDFVEAVTRGVMRALAAQDDVGGYWLRRTEQE